MDLEPVTSWRKTVSPYHVFLIRVSPLSHSLLNFPPSLQTSWKGEGMYVYMASSGNFPCPVKTFHSRSCLALLLWNLIQVVTKGPKASAHATASHSRWQTTPLRILRVWTRHVFICFAIAFFVGDNVVSVNTANTSTVLPQSTKTETRITTEAKTDGKAKALQGWGKGLASRAQARWSLPLLSTSHFLWSKERWRTPLCMRGRFVMTHPNHPS